MTIVRQTTFARLLPNAAVGGSTISWFGSNTASPWSPNEVGNFVTSPASATIPTSGPLANAAVVSNTISSFSSVGTINSWLPIQADAFTIGPTGSGCVALAGSSTFVTGPTGSVALAGSGTFTIGPTGSGSVALAGSGTFVTGPTGSVALTGGSLTSSTISSFGSVGIITRLFSEAPDCTSAAHLFKVPLSSSEPVISQWELFDEYRELGEAFGQMAELEEDDDSWIEEPVLNIARNVAVELMTNALPVPQIFNHSPSSLVFKWTHGRDTLYLTVTERNASILVSTPEQIKRRAEYTLAEFLKYENVLLLQLAYSEQITITVNGSSE
jgi:hypothetical protein